MTNHRLTQDSVMMRECRRKEQKEWFHWPILSKKGTEEKRSTTHDYSKRYKLVEVQIEPQPEGSHNGNLVFPGAIYSKEVFLLHKCPYQPKDTITWLEEWISVQDYTYPEMVHTAFYLKRDCDEQNIFQDEKVLDAEKMPPSLDSQCQQDAVVKVIVVEETWVQPRNKIEQYAPLKKWCFRILTEINNARSKNNETIDG